MFFWKTNHRILTQDVFLSNTFLTPLFLTPELEMHATLHLADTVSTCLGSSESLDSGDIIKLLGLFDEPLSTLDSYFLFESFLWHQ